MFVKDYELRYSDIDREGNIKKCAIIDLLQDISITHANHAGLDSKKMKSISMACLLSNWRIKLLNPIDVNKKVTVKTGIMKITKCEAYRKYQMWQNGECKVTATALWFTVNTEKMRIARVAEELFTAFECIAEEDNGLPCSKLHPMENAEFVGKTTVEKRDLDTNNHMNNVKSVEVALNRMPEGLEFSEIEVKYRKELKLGENIKIFAKISGNVAYSEIRNENDDLCVLIYTKK